MSRVVSWRRRRRQRLLLCLQWGVVLKMFFDFIIKLWLMFRSHHLVLWSPGTYGLREFRQGMVVQGKLHCYLIVFLGWVFICWYFLRFKTDLSSWESLYLIGLNPNHSKVWILASYLFTPCTFNTWGCTLSCNFTHYRY
jgi:hypothetical protein